MQQLVATSTVSGRRRLHLPAIGARPTVVITASTAAALAALPLVGGGDSQMAVMVFMIAVGLCAAQFGTRGGFVSGLVGAGIATIWYLDGAVTTTSTVDYVAQVASFVVVGLVVGTAVSDRRELERVVTRHHQLSLDLICIASFDGYFTSLNPAWTRVLGWDLKELMAVPYIEFIHPDDVEATIVEAERQTAAGLEVLNFQNRYRHRDGSYVWLEWTSRPDPKADALFAVARDVTARRKATDAIADYRDNLEREVADRTALLEEARVETLRRLALAAEYRDDETFEHTERVGHTAALLAAELGLSDTDVDRIRQAAPLHDVGKLGLSDTILLKPGPLTPAEFALVKRHTVDGAAILAGSSSNVLNLAEQIALAHHEWWDGSGYPNGLKGEQIPLCARIVAVADVFDALTHSRPYKQAWPTIEAVEEMRRLQDIQFDPRVTDAFLQLDHTAITDTAPDHIRRAA
jgi:PAS domain S-box-containing protein